MKIQIETRTERLEDGVEGLEAEEGNECISHFSGQLLGPDCLLCDGYDGSCEKHLPVDKIPY